MSQDVIEQGLHAHFGAYKRSLLAIIDSSAHWRTEKAAQYPDDAKRNQKAAEALRSLHEYINNLPVDHELFTTEYLVVEGAQDRDFVAELIIAEQHEAIRIYGLQAGADPQRFISLLIGFYQDHMTE